jgi:hypothetical protein
LVPNRLRRRHRRIAPHPLRQHATGLQQHLLGARWAVLALGMAHQQCVDVQETSTDDEEANGSATAQRKPSGFEDGRRPQAPANRARRP